MQQSSDVFVVSSGVIAAGLASLGLKNVHTVATDEIRFGDNDRHAALVAHVCGADALILLSDVDGFYGADPHSANAYFIPEVGIGENLRGIKASDGVELMGQRELKLVEVLFRIMLRRWSFFTASLRRSSPLLCNILLFTQMDYPSLSANIMILQVFD